MANVRSAAGFDPAATFAIRLQHGRQRQALACSGAQSTYYGRLSLQVRASSFSRESSVKTEHFEVLIIGAGLSGIGAACHLEKKCPRRDFAILEARDCVGGTWDLFRYPGVRSDSDMFTLGYSFRPWTETKSIAGGASILRYIRETARERGIDRKIRFQHHVTRASWCSEEGRWIVQAERGPSREPAYFSCNFLLMCSGYYNYAEGYTPDFAGVGRFKGRIVHPQNWTDEVAYAGKRVVVIGSGATAVTLAPELAEVGYKRHVASALAHLYRRVA